MNKTIKSGVRKMLFCMISKFEEKQREKDAKFKQKQDCLRVVLDFLKNLEDVAGVDEIVRTIEKLTDLEQNDRMRTQNQYLEEIASITEGKPIIYLDETSVHKNYKPKKSWQGPSTSGAIENISTGKRYIIVHAGSEKGPVPNSLLVFSTKSTMADYHHDMNAANFNKWLQEKLIPNLNEQSVIVMDNASYHSVIVNKAPTTL